MSVEQENINGYWDWAYIGKNECYNNLFCFRQRHKSILAYNKTPTILNTCLYHKKHTWINNRTAFNEVENKPNRNNLREKSHLNIPLYHTPNINEFLIPFFFFSRVKPHNRRSVNCSSMNINSIHMKNTRSAQRTTFLMTFRRNTEITVRDV